MKKRNDEDIKKFIEKVKAIEKGEKVDLSAGEDLSIAIMNLISIEEHLFFTFKKTNKKKYLNLLQEVREMRKEALKKIIKDYEGEIWCISKHLLAASIRFMEVGTKALTKGDDKEAEEMFEKSYRLYNLFWGMNLGLLNIKDVKDVAGKNDKEIVFINDEEKPAKKGTVGLLAKLGEIIKKAVDCCRE